MARILYVDHYAGAPGYGMEYRPYYLAREWQRLGHEVTIVAASFAHTRHRQPALTADVQADTVGGVPFRWLKTAAYSGNGLGRVRNMLQFVAALWRAGPELVRTLAPEVVIASSTYPLDIYPCARIASRAGARLVFELHDLWPLSPIEIGGMSRWHPFILMMQAAENYVCRRADRIVSILPKTRDYLVEHGMRPEKWSYVPNGIVLEEWQQPAAALPGEVGAALAECRARGEFVLLYAGAHGPANNLPLALEAARRLRDERFSLWLVGDGPAKAALAAQAAAEGLTNVRFFAPVPKSSIPSLMAAADALYFSLTSSGLFRYGISPNKLVDYMMAGRPIIAAVTAGNNPVDEHGCGFSVEAGDVEGLVAAIRRMAALPAAERDRLGEAGRRAVLANATYEVLAGRFATIFPGANA